MSEEFENADIVDEPAEVTDEELDFIADTAITVIKDIIQYFSVGDITIDEYEGDEGELILDITGDDTAVPLSGCYRR